MLATPVSTKSWKALTAMKLFSDQLWSAATDAGFDLAPFCAKDTDVELLRLAPPRFILLDWHEQGSEELLTRIRLIDDLAHVPAIAVVDDPWSSAVKDAFRHGVDDYLPRDQIHRIEQKMRSLRYEGYLDPTSTSGRVVLIDPNHQSRLRYASQLRRMGLDVTFATSIDEANIDDDVRLVVMHAHQLHQEMVDRLEKKNPSLILLGERNQLLNSISLLDHYGNQLALVDVNEDPSQIVFEANKMLKESIIQRRSSKRIPYGTPILYGSEKTKNVFGYSTNISTGGLYVRTLTPPALGTELTLEFSAPQARGRIIADGRVAWRQTTRQENSGTPLGFGVQFTSIEGPDRAALEAGYYQLLTSPSVEGASESEES